MVEKASPVGHEISCVMHGLDFSIINNHTLLKETLLAALKQEKFTVLETSSHEFQPQGFSVAVLLAESHATIHTYPEYNSLHFGLYSCRAPGDGQLTLKLLKEKLRPQSVNLKENPIVVDPNFARKRV